MTEYKPSKEQLAEWPIKTRKTNFSPIPYGYVQKEGDPKSLLPDWEVVLVVEQALDSLEAGSSLREVAAWLSEMTGKPITHSGVNLLWKRLRQTEDGDTPRGRRLKRWNDAQKPKNREHKKRRTKNQKLAAERRRIAFAEKRVQKLAQEQQEKEELEKIEARAYVEYEEIPETVEEETIFKPNPGPQTEFLSASELEVLYGGAAGGGKSYALIVDPMRYFGNSSFNGLLLRRTNDELRELIWKTQELYPKAYPGAKWSEKKSSWTFPAGGHLWLTYLERDEDVHRYQGQAFTWIGFDELTQYATPFAWNYLRSRLRTTDPELKQSLSMRGTTNPGGPGHGWVKQMFVDPAPPGKAFPATDIETSEVILYPKGHEKEGQPLFYRRFIPANLKDNPYLWEDGTYEANLLSLPEHQRRQLLEGDWSIVSGAAFAEFRVKDHVIKPFEIPDNWRKFRSCDFGYSTFSAVHWYAIDPATEQLVVYRELYTSKKTARDLAKEILFLERNEQISYGVLDSSCWHTRGNTGPTIAEEMIQEGCRWRPSDRSQGSRVAGKNRLHELLKLKDQGGYEAPGIVFFETCRQIIADLPMIPSDPKGSDDIDDRYASDHSYDSIRYGIMSRPRSKSPFDWGDKPMNFYKPSDSVFGY